MNETADSLPSRTWWNRENRPYSRHEMIADGIVHGIGLVASLAAGGVLLWQAALATGAHEFVALSIYVASLVLLWAISMAFNLWPVTPVKMHLARFDQAAIFLFIAGTYTPFLSLITQTPIGMTLNIFIWGAAVIGIGLKLLVPHRFGRIAIVLYLAVGWSGIAAFGTLASVLPAHAMWLLLGGGLAYSFGVVFHLWEKLRFQNALWHLFVGIGASMHLIAILDALVLSRM